ncbi:hypothetical protein [Bradyrhizobium sp.]|uniref:hypothetical protein n=1 Tax=Bradyrhizobium sp. TaxID=376 RepID=UPI002735965A|nr:hypothetical protein [Bradyrhizobium sp.]MDP3690601.1 hypothetical protein [Bradyrhizobium sp.]
MKTPAFVLALLLLAVLALVKAGTSSAAINAFLTVAALMMIPWYFGTRDRTKPPSNPEKIFASLWVWFRRIVALILGGPLLFGGFHTMLKPASDGPLSSWFAPWVLILFGLLILYSGWFGAGPDRYAFRDDIDQHKENKRRYGWWF